MFYNLMEEVDPEEEKETAPGEEDMRAPLQMPIATKTTATKRVWLAVFGIQVSLKETSVCGGSPARSAARAVPGFGL